MTDSSTRFRGSYAYSWEPCLARSDKLVPSCQACRMILTRKFPQAMMVLSLEDGYRRQVVLYNRRRTPAAPEPCACRVVEGSLVPCWTHSR